ncbi:hypothetical protein, partial [Nocardia farcinica]|uniref:hypothetical protein n=1 Tax=Nocardia farcinica TaxID=37329 RepID=UPI001145C604
MPRTRAISGCFFDCWDEPAPRYVPGAGRFDSGSDPDPLVRDIRVPAPGFEEGLVSTVYGRVLRWGPSWWIDHPSDQAGRVISAGSLSMRSPRQLGWRSPSAVAS